MIIPRQYIIFGMPVGALSGLRGLGADEYNLANPSNPCPPGLQLINGSCFRSPGTQETPYGTIAIPEEGPPENNTIAQRILGGGAVCAKERVSAGPYAYEQNICRDPQGNIIGGADNIAETAWVAASLRNPANPQIFPPAPTAVTPATPAGGRSTSPANPAPTPANGSGNAAAQHQNPAQNPTTVQGSKETAGTGKQIAPAGDEDGGNSFVILAIAAVGAFFLLKGGK
jgi:hypothetical protein